MKKAISNGQCPLSDDGMCVSEEECPYGCDEESRAWLAKQEATDSARMADKIYVLYRLLICSAWVDTFKALKVPFMVEAAEKRVDELRKHVTPWVFAEFTKHWPDFWNDFDTKDHDLTCFTKWESALYRIHNKSDVN